MPLRNRHNQTVRDSSSSYKVYYIVLVFNFLKGIIGSKVRVIFPNKDILPIGGVASVRVTNQQSYTVLFLPRYTGKARGGDE